MIVDVHGGWEVDEDPPGETTILGVKVVKDRPKRMAHHMKMENRDLDVAPDTGDHGNIMNMHFVLLETFAQSLNSAIPWINCHPVDKLWSGQLYWGFVQLAPKHCLVRYVMLYNVMSAIALGTLFCVKKVITAAIIDQGLWVPFNIQVYWCMSFMIDPLEII